MIVCYRRTVARVFRLSANDGLREGRGRKGPLSCFRNRKEKEMEHVFYGNENAGVTAISTEYPGIRTPGDLYDVLSGVWCEYTCAPRMRSEYSTKHMTFGQCSITAFLVQDIFGGKVYGIPRRGGTFHLYNDVDGHVFDITSEQFPNEDLCYENNPEQFREVHFSKVEKYERYQYLRKALKRACGVLPEYRYIFFDLDGTLTQSEFGIVDSVIYALKKSGIEPEDREELKKFIGPALFESFQKYYDLSDEDADRAVAYYREFYEVEGIYRAPLYDGVEKMLQDLRAKGKALYVVTTKPQEMAEIVLRHNGIDGYFQAVIGPGRSERHTDKASLIRRALRSIQASGEELVQDPETAASDESGKGANSVADHSLMVGDRYYDIEGAVQTGVDSMGVLYGYGSRQELCRAGATYIVDTPAQAAELIGGE